MHEWDFIKMSKISKQLEQMSAWEQLQNEVQLKKFFRVSCWLPLLKWLQNVVGVLRTASRDAVYVFTKSYRKYFPFQMAKQTARKRVRRDKVFVDKTHKECDGVKCEAQVFCNFSLNMP